MALNVPGSTSTDTPAQTGGLSVPGTAPAATQPPKTTLEFEGIKLTNNEFTEDQPPRTPKLRGSELEQRAQRMQYVLDQFRWAVGVYGNHEVPRARITKIAHEFGWDPSVLETKSKDLAALIDLQKVDPAEALRGFTSLSAAMHNNSMLYQSTVESTEMSKYALVKNYAVGVSDRLFSNGERFKDAMNLRIKARDTKDPEAQKKLIAQAEALEKAGEAPIESPDNYFYNRLTHPQALAPLERAKLEERRNRLSVDKAYAEFRGKTFDERADTEFEIESLDQRLAPLRPGSSEEDLATDVAQGVNSMLGSMREAKSPTGAAIALTSVVATGVGYVRGGPALGARVAKTAAGLGMGALQAKYTAVQEFGGFLRATENLNTLDGKPLNPLLRMGMAALYSAGATVIEGVEFAAYWNMIFGTKKPPAAGITTEKLKSTLLEEISKSPTIQRKIMRLGAYVGGKLASKDALGATVSEAGEEYGQNMLQALVEAFTLYAGGAEQPITPYDVSNREGLNAALSAIPGALPFSVGGTFVNLGVDTLTEWRERSAAMRGALDVAVKFGKDVKEVQALPKQVVRDMRRAVGVNNDALYADGHKLLAAVTEAGMSREDIKNTLGVNPDLLEHAQLFEDSRIKVKVDDIFQKWSSTPILEKMADHFAYRLDAPTHAQLGKVIEEFKQQDEKPSLEDPQFAESQEALKEEISAFRNELSALKTTDVHGNERPLFKSMKSLDVVESVVSAFARRLVDLGVDPRAAVARAVPLIGDTVVDSTIRTSLSRWEEMRLSGRHKSAFRNRETGEVLLATDMAKHPDAKSMKKDKAAFDARWELGLFNIDNGEFSTEKSVGKKPKNKLVALAYQILGTADNYSTSGPIPLATINAEFETRRLPPMTKEEANRSARLLRHRSSIVFTSELDGKTDMEKVFHFFHEFGHHMMDIVFEAAEAPDAPGGLKLLKKDILSAIGVSGAEWSRIKSGLRKIQAVAADRAAAVGRPNDVVYTNQELKEIEVLQEPMEQFAEQFAVYMAEGRAPSPRLKKLFVQYALWLVESIKSLMGYIGRTRERYGLLKDHPEMVAVFDRLLATDKELRKEMLWRRANTLFRSPAEGGFASPQEWLEWANEFSLDISSSAVAAYQRTVKDALDAFTNGRREQIKKRAAAIAKTPRENWDPYWAPYKLLFGESGIVFDTADAKALFPQALFDELESTGRLTDDGSGAKASLLEELKPFLDDDGKRVEDMYADGLINPGSDIDAAMQMAEEDFNLNADMADLESSLQTEFQRTVSFQLSPKWYQQEIQFLKKESEVQGPGGTPYASLGEAARLWVSQHSVADLRASKLLDRMRAASDESAKLASGGDYAKALIAKQREVFYYHAFKEASRAAGQFKELSRVLRSVGKDDNLQEMFQAGQHYVDFFGHVILKFSKNMGRFDPKGLKALHDILYQMVTENSLVEVPFNVDLLDRTLTGDEKNINQLSVEEAENLLRAMRAIRAAGKKYAYALKAGDEYYRTSLVAEMNREAREKNIQQKAPPADHGAISKLRRMKTWAYHMRRPLESIQYLADRLGDTAYSYIVERVLDLADQEAVLQEDVTMAIMDLYEKIPAEVRALHRQHLPMDKVWAMLPMPKRNGLDYSAGLTRQWALMLALNMGNRGNAYHVLAMHGWKWEQVMAFLDETLTPEEWNFVEGTWRIMDQKLYPKVEQHFRDVNGYGPGKVEGMTLLLKNGRKIEGGYFPIKFTGSAWNNFREKHPDSLRDIYGLEFQGVGVDKGFTQRRRQYASADALMDFDPSGGDFHAMNLDLNWAVLPHHISSVVHYVTFDSTVRDLYRTFRTKEFTEMVDRNLGPNSMNQFDDWIKRVARGRQAPPVAAIARWLDGISTSVNNFVAATVGASLPIMLADVVNPVIPLLHRMSAANKDLTVGGELLGTSFRMSVAGVASALSSKPNEVIEFAQKSSRAVREFSRELRTQAIADLMHAGPSGTHRVQQFSATVRRAGWWGYSKIAQLQAVSLWTARYNELRADGMAHDQAVRKADKLIDSFITSHNFYKQPAFLANRKSMSGLIAFMGFFIKMGEFRKRQTHAAVVQMIQADGGWKRRGQTYVTSGLQYAMTSLAMWVTFNVLGELIAGHGPEEDEEPRDWALRKLLAAPFLEYPLVGQVVEYGTSKAMGAQASVRTSPAVALGQRMANNMAKLIDPDEDDVVKAWAGIDTALSSLGMPSTQVRRTGGFVYDWATDEIRVDNMADFFEGVIYGPPEMQFGANPNSIWEQ